MGCLRLSSRHRQPSMLGPRLLEDSCHACSSPSTSTTSTPPGAFFSQLFSAVPAKRRPGYANFALDDPALKLVLIENPGSGGSLNHLGVEVTSTAEVIAATRRLAAAGLPTQVEEGTTYCYALQDKVWPPGRAGSAGRSTPCSRRRQGAGGHLADVGSVPTAATSSPAPTGASPTRSVCCAG